MKSLHIARTANANLQNRINVSIIFNYIRESGPLYRAQIAKDLGVSAPAVSRAIENLVEEGYILQTEKQRTESGKRATHVVVNPEKGFVVGVDLMSRPIRIGVSDYRGRILGEHDCFYLENEPNLERTLTEEIRRIVRQQRSPKNLKGICIGIPAIVDQNGAVRSAILYAGLEGKNLKEALEQSFGVPVFAENDANLSALAESRFGAGRGRRSFVFVEVGDGVGAGLVVDSALHRGFRGAAGEIGYCRLYGAPRADGVRRKGSFESRVSVESMRERAIAAAKRARRSILLELAEGRLENVTPAMVCRAAVAGDTACRRLTEELSDLIATMVINVSLVVDPECIILGGELFHLPEVERLFVRPIREALAATAPFETPEIVLSTLGENSVIVGASELALESLLVRAYPYRIEPGAASASEGASVLQAT